MERRKRLNAQGLCYVCYGSLEEDRKARGMCFKCAKRHAKKMRGDEVPAAEKPCLKCGGIRDRAPGTMVCSACLLEKHPKRSCDQCSCGRARSAPGKKCLVCIARTRGATAARVKFRKQYNLCESDRCNRYIPNPKDYPGAVYCEA